MASYSKRPAPKPRKLPVVESFDPKGGFLVTRDTTQVKPPSAEELRRMKKREMQRRMDTI